MLLDFAHKSQEKMRSFGASMAKKLEKLKKSALVKKGAEIAEYITLLGGGLFSWAAAPFKVLLDKLNGATAAFDTMKNLGKKPKKKPKVETKATAPAAKTTSAPKTTPSPAQEVSMNAKKAVKEVLKFKELAKNRAEVANYLDQAYYKLGNVEASLKGSGVKWRHLRTAMLDQIQFESAGTNSPRVVNPSASSNALGYLQYMPHLVPGTNVAIIEDYWNAYNTGRFAQYGVPKPTASLIHQLKRVNGATPKDTFDGTWGKLKTPQGGIKHYINAHPLDQLTVGLYSMIGFIKEFKKKYPERNALELALVRWHTGNRGVAEYVKKKTTSKDGSGFSSYAYVGKALKNVSRKEGNKFILT